MGSPMGPPVYFTVLRHLIQLLVLSKMASGQKLYQREQGRGCGPQDNDIKPNNRECAIARNLRHPASPLFHQMVYSSPHMLTSPHA